MKLIPSGIFFWSFVLIYYIPSIYTIYNLEELSLDNSVCQNYFIANTLFLISIGLSYLVTFFIFRKKEIGWKLISKFSINYNIDKNNIYIFSILKIFIKPLNLIFFLFFIFQTLPKILLIGSDIDPNEFRLLGFDDRSLHLTFILEIARRGVYPIICLFLLLFYKKNKMNYDILFYQSWLIFFLISLTNLDRGPIFLFFAIIIFYNLIIRDNTKFNKYFITLLLIIILSVILALLTYVQYNILDFEFETIKNLTFNIILKRIILDPSITSYRYSFELIRNSDDFLHLKYSRLFSLFTGTYINSQSDKSIYVTPVGIVGDLWRNFGYLGIIIFGFFTTLALNYLNNLYIKSSYYMIHISNLLVFILVGAIIFGGVFSYQPFFLFLLIIFLNKITRIKIIKQI
jgi:hypothetical protein